MPRINSSSVSNSIPCKRNFTADESSKTAYISQLSIDDIARKLQAGEVNIPTSGLEDVMKAVAEMETTSKQVVEQPDCSNQLSRVELIKFEFGNRGHLVQDCRSEPGQPQGSISGSSDGTIPGVDGAKADENFGGNNSIGNNRGRLVGYYGNNGGGYHVNHHRGGGPPQMSCGNNFKRGFWRPHHRSAMMRSGYHGGPPRLGPGFHGSRGPPPGAFQNRPPMMNRGGPLQPWYLPGNGPYGGAHPTIQMGACGHPHRHGKIPVGSLWWRR